MKYVALVGSLRRGSYNLQLTKTIQDRYRGNFDLEILDIGVLPHYDQDVENDAPEIVKTFKNKVFEADGVIIVTPEYNWSIPGVLKNAMDWLSRVDKVLVNKPVMIAGVSVGILGTIRAQLHLRQVLASPGLQAKVLPAAGNEVLVNLASGKFDETKELLTDEGTLQHLDGVVKRFIEFVGEGFK
ncbi:NADPH-dependent FMN reductase [Bacillus marasmi]|uniref:NADPH-dependent FMN reductase n=1 Tax=Bacillus marasmi TaxID=1926279 RepID=UPI0011C81564|nr:NADPH-dependent FMN reductase [Bacillus marasmi]